MQILYVIKKIYIYTINYINNLYKFFLTQYQEVFTKLTQNFIRGHFSHVHGYLDTYKRETSPNA